MWTKGFFEMNGYMKSMLFQNWKLVSLTSGFAGTVAALLAASSYQMHQVACFFLVGLIGTALTQYYAVPLVVGWSMQRSFRKHFDMNPRHMCDVWLDFEDRCSTMLVAIDSCAPTGAPLGVVAVVAGGALTTLPALRKVQSRAESNLMPLFGAAVAAEARNAASLINKPSRRACTVFRVSVRGAARGHGIGRKLMEAAELWARKRGFNHVELTTASPSAISFYECLGYTVHLTKFSIFGFRVVHMSKQLSS
jgi:GNAT superfamily N-acetyltransferase